MASLSFTLESRQNTRIRNPAQKICIKAHLLLIGSLLSHSEYNISSCAKTRFEGVFEKCSLMGTYYQQRYQLFRQRVFVLGDLLITVSQAEMKSEPQWFCLN